MDKRYVNVVGGTRDSKDIATVAMELTDAGFGDARIVFAVYIPVIFFSLPYSYLSLIHI